MPIANIYLADSAKPEKDTIPRLYQPVNANSLSHHGALNHSETNDVPLDNTNKWERDLGIDEFESRNERIKRVKREQRPVWAKIWAGSMHYNRRVPSVMRTEPFLPAPKRITEEAKKEEPVEEQYIQPSSGIERPRSALHRGDFREHTDDNESHHIQPGSPRPYTGSLSHGFLGSASSSFWTGQEFPVAPSQFTYQKEAAPKPSVIPNRSRAASHSSLSSSFTYRTPTSKLVQQSNSNDFEVGDEPFARTRTRTPEKVLRRRTYSPRPEGQWTTATPLDTSSTTPILSEGSNDYGQLVRPNTHQRRSLTALPDMQIGNSPVVSSAHLRRPSISSDASLRQHAPMVGRYEESILRGRMSTLPSRPFDFVAQIGVLGKGQCKPSLRCPPHVMVPFPAVFYSYGNQSGRSLGGGPSPYVGLVDLDILSKKSNSRAMVSEEQYHPSVDDTLLRESSSAHGLNYSGPESRSDTRPSHTSKSSRSLKKPPNGSYRIPQQGQLQIIIKNPNKTAVKLFLVPYDLSGMGAGQKTFIRQRSYSAGPIIDMPLSSRKNFGTDRPEAALSTSDDPNDRPILRYLIHLHICCPSEGRFYLYKGIRVVFANRVPDGKEKLRNEVQFPEPRYNAYKAEPDSVHHELAGGFNVLHPDGASRVHAGKVHRISAPLLNPFWSSPQQNEFFSGSAHPASNSGSKMFQNSSYPRDVAATSLDAVGEELSPRSSDVTTHDNWHLPTARANLHEQNEHIYEQPTYGKLQRENMREMHRARSPKPGEGLIAQKFRDWAAEKSL